MKIPEYIKAALTSNASAKTILEDIYAKAPYGSVSVIVDDVKPRIDHEMMLKLIVVLMMRASNFYADMLVRTTGSRVCNPHLRTDYYHYMRNKDGSIKIKDRQFVIDSNRPFVSKFTSLSYEKKWNINDKLNASLGQGIVYAYKQCSDKYVGAIIPLFVITKSGEQHANMIYINFTTKPVRVLLFEPNGRHFYSQTHVLRDVRAAVREANEISGKSLFTIDIPDGFLGVQSALSFTSRSTCDGIGICGAVTFWVLYTWMNEHGAKGKFTEFTYKFADVVRNDPLKYRLKMYSFLKQSYEKTNSRAGRDALRDYMNSTLPKNVKTLSKLSLNYTIQLGRVKVKGTVTSQLPAK